MRTPLKAGLVAAVLALAATGCGGDDERDGKPAAGSTSRSAEIDIASFMYRPPRVTVAAGATVTWVNRDTAPHTATAPGKRFDTGTLRKGQRRGLKLDKPGTYRYYCEFHRFMEATVVVR